MTWSSAQASHLDYVFAVDIAAVDGQPEDEETPEGETWLGIFASLSCDMQGKAVLDIGATATAGSLQAIDHIVRALSDSGETETLRVYPGCQRQFRFGNGQVSSSLSYIEIPQRLDGKLIHLGVHTIDADGVPILLSVKTLKKLGAIIDVARRLVIFQSVNARVAARLQESPSGHLLLDLCSDWMSGAVCLDRFWGEGSQSHDQTSHSKTEGAYMVYPDSGQVPLVQSEAGLDITSHEQAYAVANPHVGDSDHMAESHLALLAQTVQALERCFHPLSLHGESGPERGDHGDYSGESGTEGQSGSIQEHNEGKREASNEASTRNLVGLFADSRPRSARSSSRGAAVHGRTYSRGDGPWLEVRKERTWGVDHLQGLSHSSSIHPSVWSHSSASSPGPLPSDVTEVLKEVQPVPGSKETIDELNTREVAIAGAEASLHRRLQELQRMKGAKAKNKANPTTPPPTKASTTAPPISKAAAPSQASETPVEQDWVMPNHGSRRKPNTLTAEEAEEIHD